MAEHQDIRDQSASGGSSTIAVDAGDDRFERLREAAAALRTRARSIDVERGLMIGGAVALPFGIAAILWGWAGAAHTPYTFEQVPYLISGGLFGVALVVVGGFLYFGYWISRMVREQRAQAERVAEAIGRLESVLATGSGAESQPSNGHARRASTRSGRSERRAANGGATFVATPSGSMFHRPDCAVVSDRRGLRRVSGVEDGYQPCGICDPLATV